MITDHSLVRRMLRHIDRFLNATTMYRMVLYGLFALAAVPWC